jgi:hypothetical protein
VPSLDHVHEVRNLHGTNLDPFPEDVTRVIYLASTVGINGTVRSATVILPKIQVFQRTKSAPFPMVESLEIRARLPNSRFTVRVNKHDPVSVLSALFPPSESCRHLIIYAGELVMPAFTFAFYHISDGDEIELIESPIDEAAAPQPQRATFRQFPSLAQLRERSNELYQLFGYRSDGESMQRAIEELADPQVASESAKIRDQCFNRIEGSFTCHRRLLTRFTTLNERKEPTRVRCARCELPAPTSPSSEELPCFWARRKKNRGDE